MTLCGIDNDQTRSLDNIRRRPRCLKQTVRNRDEAALTQ